MPTDDRKTTGNGSHTHRRTRTQPHSQGRTNAGEDTRPVVQIRSRVDQPYQSSYVPSVSRGAQIWGMTVVGARNLGQGALGLYDSVLSGFINPSKTRESRGTARQKVAALSTALLATYIGAEVAPVVIELTTETPGQSFTSDMYKNRSAGTEYHDSVLPTRIGWVTDSFGPNGANILTSEGIKKIEHVGEYPSKYDEERGQIEDGFTALDRIADIVSTQGRDQNGNVRQFDLTDEHEAKLAGLLIEYTSDAVNSGLVDAELLKLTPNEMLFRVSGVDQAFDRANHLLHEGGRGDVPTVTAPVIARPDQGGRGR